MSDINREADYVASLLDSNNDHQAADRLRADLATMDRASFMTLVNQIRQKEQKGMGADLNVYRWDGPGYFQNALISVDKTILQGDSRSPALYQQPIAQYQFPVLDWGRWYLR